MKKNKLEPREHPDFLKQAYAIDPQSGAILLEVAVPRCADLFNPIDQAPLARRDLSADIKQFLTECSRGIPLEYPVVLVIHARDDAPQPLLQESVTTGLRTYFSYLISLIEQDLRAERDKLIRFVAISLSLLTAGALLASSPLDKQRIGYILLSSGLTVGGWVFLWEAFYARFIRRLDTRSQKQRIERLLRAEIRFTWGQGSC